nr:uncharacterized mitochondrial protein AtMg00810-like [Tanacetum cinerariifolium]
MEKIRNGGWRKLTTACKGYDVDVSMSDIDVNKLYHMEDAYGILLGIHREARLLTLITEFENLKMSDNDSIDVYAAKLSGIVTQTEGEDVVRTHEVMVKDVVGATLKNQGQRDSSKNCENNRQKGKQKEQCDLSHIKSYRCDKFGHFVLKCPYRKRDYEANLSETHEGDVNHEEGTFFMMNHIQEMIFMNKKKYTPPKNGSNTDENDVWYFDNGASYHMTAIVSGCDIRIRGDFLTMRDSRGNLLIKVPRTANRLYKAQLKVRYMWSFLLNHKSDAFGVIKRFKTLIEKRTGVTPYEKFYGEKPNLEDLKVFGRVAYERIVSKHLRKLDDSSKPLVYLSKEPSSGGFRLYNPHENKIIISPYVICDENRGWKWKAESSTQTRKEEDTFTVLWNDTKGAEFQQPLNENTTNGPDVQEQPTHGRPQITSTFHATIPSTVHTTVPITVHATVRGQNAHLHNPQTPTNEDDFKDDDVVIPVRRSTRNKVLPTRLVDYQLNVHELMLTLDEEPRNYNEAKLKPQWLKAMKTELELIVKNNTLKLVHLPKGVVPIGLQWLFKIKKKADVSIKVKYKAHLGAKGYVQQPEIDFDENACKKKAVYKAVTNGEFIIVAVYVDDLFVTWTSLDCINKFKRRMASQFEMSDLGELTYYLGIKVSQGKDCVEIKQERYARKILKEAGMEDCNATSYPMEKDLKLSKVEDEPEVEATNIDLTYSVGVASRYMQSPRKSHARAIKQILRYLKGTTSFGIKYNRSNDMKLVRYNDSIHNLDIGDGRSTTGHVFYLGTSPITWCSQKQTIIALSLCEAEFMAATSAACQAIWLRDLLTEVTGLERQKVIIRVDNKSAITLSKNSVFHGRSKHIHTRYHFIRECVKNEQVIVEHVSGENPRADTLMKALACIRFKEMISLLGVQELPSLTQKFRGRLLKNYLSLDMAVMRVPDNQIS